MRAFKKGQIQIELENDPIARNREQEPCLGPVTME